MGELRPRIYSSESPLVRYVSIEREASDGSLVNIGSDGQPSAGWSSRLMTGQQEGLYRHLFVIGGLPPGRYVVEFRATADPSAKPTHWHEWYIAPDPSPPELFRVATVRLYDGDQSRH